MGMYNSKKINIPMKLNFYNYFGVYYESTKR